MVYSQRDPKKYIDKLGRNANTFFLTANRPTYDVLASLLEKGESEISITTDFNRDILVLPVQYSYGISNKFQLSAGMDLLNATYRFNGQKVRGIGDANISASFMFQESSHFTHVFTALVKLPTAPKSDQLGTGYADYHFGLAEGFTQKSFSYELGVMFSLLHRRDLPVVGQGNFITQAIVDSAKKYYDYTFEPEVSVTLTPSLSLSKQVLWYAGGSVAQNTRLDYTSLAIYTGISYTPSYAFGMNLGVSQGLDKAGIFTFSAGFIFTFR